MEFSTSPPPEGWCQHYWDYDRIERCQDQVNRIDTEHGVVWFVLAAWSEAKAWCGTEFGLGSYDPASFVFTDHGPCWPQDGLEIPTASWPGPGEGTAIVATGSPWQGNFVPVYYFCGYPYEEDLIPLAADPATGFAGWSNCETPPGVWSADSLGGMGLFRDGIYVCPEATLGGGGGLGPTGPEAAVCCLEGQCRTTTREECEQARGTFHPEYVTCDPSPCEESLFGREQILRVCPYDTTYAYNTIQDAIGDAQDGDIIELCCDSERPFSGDGNSDIVFPNKMITIRSECDDPTRCIIDCNGAELRPHRGFLFSAAPHPDLRRLRGITIQHAYTGT